MKVNGKDYRTVWMEGNTVCLIEQNLLPFEFKIFRAASYRDTCMVISTMIVRGAGAIGATAGYAMAQAFFESNNDSGFIENARQEIENTRPTAQNLFMQSSVCTGQDSSQQDNFHQSGLSKKRNKLLMKMPMHVKKSASWAMN